MEEPEHASLAVAAAAAAAMAAASPLSVRAVGLASAPTSASASAFFIDGAATATATATPTPMPTPGTSPMPGPSPTPGAPGTTLNVPQFLDEGAAALGSAQGGAGRGAGVGAVAVPATAAPTLVLPVSQMDADAMKMGTAAERRRRSEGGGGREHIALGILAGGAGGAASWQRTGSEDSTTMEPPIPHDDEFDDGTQLLHNAAHGGRGGPRLPRAPRSPQWTAAKLRQCGARARAAWKRLGHGVVAFLWSAQMMATAKESLAFFICIVPQLIPPLAAAMGQQAYLGSLAVVMGMVSASVGRNVLNALSIALGTVVGSAAGLAVVVVAQDSTWLLLLGLFLFDCSFNLLRALRPAAGMLASLCSMNLIIVIMQTSDGRAQNPSLSVADIGIDVLVSSVLAYGLGAVLAFLVSIVVFPRKAGERFREQVGTVLSDVYDMLATSTIRLREPGSHPRAMAGTAEPRVRGPHAAASKRHRSRWSAWTKAMRERWRQWEQSSSFMRQSDGEYNSAQNSPNPTERRNSLQGSLPRGPSSVSMRSPSSGAASATASDGAAANEPSARKELLDTLRASRQAAMALTDILQEARWEFGAAFYHYGHHQRIIGHLQHMVRVACAIESEEFQYVLEADTLGALSDAGGDRRHSSEPSPASGSLGPRPSPMFVAQVSPARSPAGPPGPGSAGPDLSAAGIMATTLPLSQLQRMFEQYALDLVLSLYDGSGREPRPGGATSGAGGAESDRSTSTSFHGGTPPARVPWLRRAGSPPPAEIALSTQEVDAGLEDLHSILQEYDRRLGETSIWIADDRAALFDSTPVKVGAGGRKTKLPDLDAGIAVGGLPYKLVAIRELLVEMLLLMETIREMHDSPRSFRRSFASLLRDLVDFRTTETSEMRAIRPGTLGAVEPDHRLLRYRVWRLAKNVSSQAFKFSLKTSIAIVLIGILSFSPLSSDVFHVWRGLWALITISVVSSPTFGGNIVNSLYRIAGTVVAALWSIGVESAFPGNVAAVVSFTMLFVIPFTYLKLGTTYRKVGLQALSALVSIQLAYMATPSNPGVWSTIYELAYKRTLAIVVGVLVALVVGRVVWPILSRVEMRKTLAKSVRELALIYSLLQGSVEGQLLKLQDEVPAIKALESEAQNHILQTEDFMEMARVEPRLKGPLPMILYDRMLMHAQRVLDQLTLLRTLMMRGAGFELHQDLKVRSMLATAAIEERREQTVSMQLYFYVVETSIENKRPLLYHMPDVARAVQRAFRKWRKLMMSMSHDSSLASGRGSAAPPPAGPGNATVLVGRSLADAGAGSGGSAGSRHLLAPPTPARPVSRAPVQDFGTVLVTAYAVALLDLSRTLELMGADAKALFGVNAYLHYGKDFRRQVTTGSVQ